MKVFAEQFFARTNSFTMTRMTRIVVVVGVGVIEKSIKEYSTDFFRLVRIVTLDKRKEGRSPLFARQQSDIH